MAGQDVERHPLTYVRRQHGWSMEQLAHRLTLAARSRGMICRPGRDRIYKWETRRASPGDDYQMLLADVLGIDQNQVQHLGWPWWLPAFDTPHPFTPRGSRAALTEVLTALAHPDRRAFLALTTGALIGVGRDWATIEPGRLTSALDGRRVDATLVTWLEARTSELRALTNTSAPECTDLVHALLTTTIKLIDTAVYDEPTGRRLHQVTASAAQCAGWLHFDQRQHAAAQHHWTVALHAAHTATDHDLGAGILSDLAYSATWLNQAGTALTLLDHARTRTHAPAARSLLDLRSARAHASLGDTPATSRALTSAERHLDRSRPDTAPAWVSWMSPADLAVDTGRCWLDLGHPDRADQTLGEGLSMLDPSRARTRSVVLAYRAESALHRHDIPAAAATAREALDTALATNATRCIDLAHATVDRLRAHRHPEITALHAHRDHHGPGKQPT